MTLPEAVHQRPNPAGSQQEGQQPLLSRQIGRDNAGEESEQPLPREEEQQDSQENQRRADEILHRVPGHEKDSASRWTLPNPAPAPDQDVGGHQDDEGRRRQGSENKEGRRADGQALEDGRVIRDDAAEGLEGGGEGFYLIDP